MYSHPDLPNTKQTFPTNKNEHDLHRNERKSNNDHRTTFRLFYGVKNVIPNPGNAAPILPPVVRVLKGG